MYSIWLEKSNIAVIFIQNSGGHMKDNKNRDQPVVVVDGGGGPVIYLKRKINSISNFLR